MKIIAGSHVTVTWPTTGARHSGRVTEVEGDHTVFVTFKHDPEGDDTKFTMKDGTWYDAGEYPHVQVEMVLDVI